MNIQEARNHIGKEVVLDESTKPYKFLNGGDIPKQIIESFIGTRATIAQINSLGSVEIDFTLSDGSSDYWWFNPHHLKIKEKPMKKYKIRVTPETSGEVQKLFFALGYSWSSNINQPKYLNDRFLYTENGLISATNDYGMFIDNPAKGITLPELRKLGLDSKNEYGFETEIERHEVEPHNKKAKGFFDNWKTKEMTWQDALRAVADGKDVEILMGGKWLAMKNYYSHKKFRIKTPSITLETRAYTKEELLAILDSF